MWIDGQLVFSESDVVKMCIVVFMPVIAMAVVSLIAGISELIKNRKNGNG